MPRKRADKLARSAEPAGIRHTLIRQHAGNVQVEFRQRSPAKNFCLLVGHVYLVVSERYLTCEWFATRTDMLFPPTVPCVRCFFHP